MKINNYIIGVRCDKIRELGLRLGAKTGLE